MIFWHRFYDPDTGRYVSADPIGLDGGMNLYAYVGGDPVNLVDPEGLEGFAKDYPNKWSDYYFGGPGKTPPPEVLPPPKPCPERQKCIESAKDFNRACQAGLTLAHGACWAICTACTEGMGVFACYSICGTAFAPKRAGCYALYRAMLVDCDKIPCNDECEE